MIHSIHECEQWLASGTANPEEVPGTLYHLLRMKKFATIDNLNDIPYIMSNIEQLDIEKRLRLLPWLMTMVSPTLHVDISNKIVGLYPLKKETESLETFIQHRSALDASLIHDELLRLFNETPYLFGHVCAHILGKNIVTQEELILHFDLTRSISDKLSMHLEDAIQGSSNLISAHWFYCGYDYLRQTLLPQPAHQPYTIRHHLQEMDAFTYYIVRQREERIETSWRP